MTRRLVVMAAAAALACAAEAKEWSSHHGDPKRDDIGTLRPFFRPGSDNPSNSLDHVHYRGVAPLALRVDRSQDALECSDHSPVIFTFKLN